MIGKSLQVLRALYLGRHSGFYLDSTSVKDSEGALAGIGERVCNDRIQAGVWYYL